jgi:single-strand DNA-binding protein
MSVNKVILIGNLGKDPELRFTSTGSVWGKQGESCSQYLAKGRQVFVEGSIRSRSYDDKSGTKRYVTEIVAQRIRFLGGGGGTRMAPETEGGASEEIPSAGGQPPFDDDIPF